MGFYKWENRQALSNNSLVRDDKSWYNHGHRAMTMRPSSRERSRPVSTFAQKEGKRFSCPRCGGGLQYDIPSGQMKCLHCDNLTPIDSLPAADAADTTMEVTEFRCPQCGAAVYSSDTSITSFCSFCGSDVVLTAKLTRTKRPARIVPFTVTRDQCESRYREHLKKYHLVPRELKATETISHFRAVYVPFWSYHLTTQGPIELTATKSYTRGNTRYDETYKLTTDAVIDQKDVLYDASTAFEDETAAMLKHTTEQARPFHPAYLSGFFAQAADVAPETYYKEAAATAIRIFIERVKKDNNYNSVKSEAAKEPYFGLPDPHFEQELIMLPVWLLAHRQNDRIVYTAINGCTGEVVCDVPVGVGRVSGVTGAVTVGLFVLLYLLLTIKPDLLMALCAVLSLITQYRFTAMHEMLYNRKTRAFEPDFSDKTFSFPGPAQQLLNGGAPKSAKDGKSFASIVSSVMLVFFVVFGLLGERIFDILGSLADNGIGQMSESLALFILLPTTLLMVIHTVKWVSRPERGSIAPRILSCLACGAGLYLLLSLQAEDVLFYSCAFVMLLAAIWELLLIIRAHNEYASRPVPYFDGKEDRL